MRKKGIMAMEGLDLPPEEAPVDAPTEDTPPVERSPEELEAERVEGEVEAATDFVDAPEADILAADDADGELAAIDDNLDEACATSDTLDELEGAVRDSVEEGGLAEGPAEAIRVAVEHMRTRLTFPASSRKVFPAMEGFGDRATRLRATKYALEGIEKTNRSVKDAIVATLNKALEWLKKFFSYITDAAARAIPQAEQIAKAAASVSGKAAPAEAKVSASGFGKILAVGGKVPEGSAFVAEFKKYLQEAAALSKGQLDLAAAGGQALGAIIAAGDDEAKLNQGIGDMAEAFVKGAQGKRSANKDLGGDGLEVYEINLGFADKSFYSVVGSGEAMARSQFFVNTSTGARPAGDIADVAPLSPRDAEQVAKLAAEHLRSYEGFAAEISEIDKTISAVSKAVDGGSSAKISGVARAYVGALTKGAKGLRSYDVMVVKGALNYAAASLQALKASAQQEIAPEAKPAAAAA